MTRTTEAALRALVKADDTIPQRLVEPAVDVLHGRTAAGLVVNDKLDQVLKRRQVAELLKCNVKSVDRYCRKGQLVRIPGGGDKALGILAGSVREFQARRVMRDAIRG